jgi:hypothetical protein
MGTRRAQTRRKDTSDGDLETRPDNKPKSCAVEKLIIGSRHPQVQLK